MARTDPTVPTASGRERAARTLILTVTRRCDLRCAYCPTAKDGHPELSVEQTTTVLDLFADRYGGGDVKLFGGEPLLVPEVVRAAIRRAAQSPAIRRIYLSTNGLGLNADWLALVRSTPKLILTISMDGAPTDHRRFRRALPGVADAYDHIISLLPELLRTPRVVVTLTVPPASAERMGANFAHLRSLGMTRFNLLPGYFLPWRDEQLVALRAGFDQIASSVRRSWGDGQYVYVRNLFTWAPTPFFNTGLVVDSDGSVHSSNVVLSGKLEALGDQTRLGTLAEPPDAEALDVGARRTWALLEESLPPRIITSTRAADAELTRFVQGLYPHWARWRQQRRAGAGAPV